MDFNSIEIETRAKPQKATVVKFVPLDDDGKPLMSIGGVPLELQLLPMSSPEGARELQKWRLKFGNDDGAHMTATEEELDRLADTENERGAELAARVVAGWNIKDKNGKDVPCSFENRKACFQNEQFAPVAIAVMSEVTKIAAQLGNSKKA